MALLHMKFALLVSICCARAIPILNATHPALKTTLLKVLSYGKPNTATTGTLRHNSNLFQILLALKRFVLQGELVKGSRAPEPELSRAYEARTIFGSAKLSCINK